MKRFVTQYEYYPRTVLLELCYKCNFKCRHCGSSLNAFGHDREGAPLTSEEIRKVIEDLRGLKAEHLVLTGGESLLASNWEEIAKYAINLGYRVSLISNGFLINKEVAKRIVDAGIKLVAMSLDGTKEIHNYLRRNDKAFDFVMSATEILKTNGIQVNYVTTIMNLNINLLDEIEEIAYKSGIDFWQIQLGIPMGQLAENKELVIEPLDVIKVRDFIIAAKRRNRVKITTADSIGYCSESEIELRNNAYTEKNHITRCFLGCNAGCYGIAIESTGDVKGCLSLQDKRFVEGNIRESSIVDIWKSNKSFSYTRHMKETDLKGFCKDCEFGAFCKGGCSSMAYNATGELHNNPYCLYLIEKNLQQSLNQ